ncbi:MULTISPECIES: hypothetical protein [Enterococcus]|uniref:Uncharacterized protein n=1 Tax=Enterococcus mundtii TaxID=53346 RepID=A0A1L8V1L0_ENTMU|nr:MULTISPECIES: hypothetical protein [Enterococcus]AUB52395.1 hypothetical protein EM4838_05155 [Enterococcus mundtii]MDB7088342.1 hypothetical protein [Enterococcus mundtii]MZZ58053.1 hypothetical protein [Enterococcus mundtii]MZZ61028.1 hypothetical protein [Enterococcus mundtii]MZZ68013.1 hypothetical protein [Enterococcus mundtii]
MEIQQKTTTYLHWGSVFAVLNALLFFFYAYFKTSSIPCNSFGWLLLDHSELNQSTDNPTFLILSTFCGLIFSLCFAAYFAKKKMNTFNEVNVIFVILKSLNLLTAMLYTFNQDSLFFFIINGLVVILTIFTFFIFSLITKQLRMPMVIQTSTFFCFCYSLVALFILAFAPSINSANIQITSNILDILFIGNLAYMMWHFRKTA